MIDSRRRKGQHKERNKPPFSSDRQDHHDFHALVRASMSEKCLPLRAWNVNTITAVNMDERKRRADKDAERVYSFCRCSSQAPDLILVSFIPVDLQQWNFVSKATQVWDQNVGCKIIPL